MFHLGILSLRNLQTPDYGLRTTDIYKQSRMGWLSAKEKANEITLPSALVFIATRPLWVSCTTEIESFTSFAVCYHTMTYFIIRRDDTRGVNHERTKFTHRFHLG